MSKPIRTIVVEDQPLYRDLLVSSLADSNNIVVVQAFAGGADALSRMELLSPDVVLMDIELGGGQTGVEVGIKMREQRPGLGVVLLSNYDEPGVLKLIPRGEVSGWCYLLKKSVSNIHVLVRAIESASTGMVVLDPALVAAFEPKRTSVLGALTVRQREILGLIAQGYSNVAIAEALGITLKSVENYITQLYQGLAIDASQDGLHPRVSATLTYLNELASSP